MPYRKSRITSYLLLVIFLIVTLFTVYDYIDYQKERSEKSINLGDEVKQNIAFQIDSILSTIAQKGRQIADSLEKRDFKPEQLKSFIRSESFSMNQILGITIAYEPFAFSDSIKLFAPYYDKSHTQFINIEDIYNYTDSTLTTSKWYTTVRDQGESWIEPYFAQGAQTMVSDFGTPFYLVENGNKKLLGTVTLTISLEDFTRLLHSISLGRTGYGFVTSKDGNIISHPISEYVSTKNIKELAKEKDDDVLMEVANKMVDQQSGFVQYEDKISKQVSYLFYTNIPTANWGLGIVFIKSELLGTAESVKQKQMHILFAASLLLLTVIIVSFKLYKYSEANLWKLTTVVSIIVTFNIIFIWQLTLKFAYSQKSDDDNIVITNYSALNSFITQEQNKAQLMNTAPPVLVPTGIYLQGIEFADSYNVNVSGTIWQKYHNLIPLDIKRDVRLTQVSPFAEALHVKQKSREVFEDYELLTWEFRATLRLDFDYSTYPFDYRQINIEISHPDIQKNVMLTPDLVSYKIITPTSKPGINQSLVLPESIVTSSYFNFSMKRYNTNFGNVSLVDKELFPGLKFNVILKRQFINAFVSNIIPILIVVLMMFFVVFSSTKNPGGRKAGVSSLGVVESSAAFFFVLILAHIDLRKTVNTPVITYMEYFYFIMYFILAIVVFNIVLFTRRDNFLFFDYKDNLIVKLCYWPLFLIMCFLITIIKFY